MRLGDLTMTLRLLRLTAEGHLETDAPEPAPIEQVAGWKAQERELPTAVADDPLILRSGGARE